MSEPIPYLDPLSKALADKIEAGPPIEDLTFEQFRELVEQLQEHTPIPDINRASFTVPFEDGVKTFIFKPKGVSGTLPVILYLHGGGWVAGSVNSYDSICRDLVLQTGCAVVFPEYTLAPEARYPTQQEQCYAALKWVSQHGNSKGLSQELITVVGDSAGGQLTLAVTILASTRTPTIPILLQTIISPVTDTVTSDRETPSGFRFFNGPLFNVPLLRKVIDAYIPKPEDRVSELATPRNISTRHAKLQPPTLIINSAVDFLRDDGKLYGEILQKAGVDCSIFTLHGQLHDTVLFEATRNGPTPRTVIQLIAAKIKNAIAEATTQTKVSTKRRIDEESDNLKGNGTVKGRKRRTRKQ
ncbi:hypothetical protein EJ04DRAFT_507736 [Polyplosphaeria fusca]|uniref:Alpha/beta hydrolase fold-3 domain-containing protein n=1 Tax=Polyplosphaeria fusca TaxID=682080 RepID=A0A9P4V8V7_9PLEO|nr:hypothetical protein EJ04DRAFT_507736 [Polyplosphaeria fusca]